MAMLTQKHFLIQLTQPLKNGVMKKIYLLLAAFYMLQLPLTAQTNTNPCAGLAKFQYSIDGNTVKFTSTPVNTNVQLIHFWKLGDGSTADNVNPVHVYANGSYRVVHYIKDTLHQCYDSAVAEFTIQNTTICPKPIFEWKKDSLNYKTISFYNTTGPLPTTYKFTWQFGDGTSSAEPNPKHVYADTGVYNVCLIIEQLNGLCKNYSCQTVVIRPNCEIKPDFTWEITAANPLKVYFKNTSAPNTTPNVIFTWSFGDGAFSNEVSPQHEYAKPGVYQVCLKMQVTNSSCIKYICKEVAIRPACNNLVAKFEWKQDSAHPLRGVQFINLSSPLSTTTQSGVRWNFGDGATSNEWNPFHQYNEPGNYRVCLTIKYADSCYKETCDTVVIPRPEINCQDISKFKMERFTDNRLGFYFNAIYKNPNWNYIWTFGDGTGMKGMEAKHVYDKPGKYVVCLTVYKTDNCASTTCIEVIAGNVACADFQFKFDYAKGTEVPNRISFHAVSNASLGSVKWLIYNTNSTSSSPVILYGVDPVYTFTQTGLYKVCAIGYSNTGCYREYCDTLRIDKVIAPQLCELKIYPNPASSYIEFDVQSEANGVLVINIFDMTGIKRSQFLVAGQQGNNHIRIPVETLSAGYYTIEILQSNGRVCKGRFQKL